MMMMMMMMMMIRMSQQQLTLQCQIQPQHVPSMAHFCFCSIPNQWLKTTKTNNELVTWPKMNNLLATRQIKSVEVINSKFLPKNGCCLFFYCYIYTFPSYLQIFKPLFPWHFPCHPTTQKTKTRLHQVRLAEQRRREKVEQQTKIKTPRRRKTAFKKRARGFLIGSMGLEYLPTFTIKINQIEVNNHTWILWLCFQHFSAFWSSGCVGGTVFTWEKNTTISHEANNKVY